jgi:hypothetical protein
MSLLSAIWPIRYASAESSGSSGPGLNTSPVSRVDEIRSENEFRANVEGVGSKELELARTFLEAIEARSPQKSSRTCTAKTTGNDRKEDVGNRRCSDNSSAGCS